MLLQTDPFVIVFYGPDEHEGKTILAKNLEKLLLGAVMWSSEDLVEHKSKWPKVDDVRRMCEKRKPICNVCKIEGGSSYQHVKRWTSDAPVQWQDRLLAPDVELYDKNAVSNSIGKRLVIYDMRGSLGKFAPYSTAPSTTRFIYLCVA
ncbi:hypothetical protein K4K55_004933 [Colletotrichum sp. SAR 10_96]|nr:hypothetical protein K4K55_004933 [Colletotrichum sp. SAR 10_96]